MVYGIYNYSNTIVTGAYKPTNMTGGPHIVVFITSPNKQTNCH